MTGKMDPLNPLRPLLVSLSALQWKNASLLDILLPVLVIWAFVEACFWVFVHFYLLPKLQSLSKPLPPRIEPVQMIQNILRDVESLNCYTFETFTAGFFRGAKMEDIYADNIRSFLSWAMFGVKYENLSGEYLEKLELAFQYVEKKFGIIFKEGYNPDVKHVCMTWEEVPYIHRPLLLYIGSGCMEFLTTTVMFRLRGFRSLSYQGINYWYRSAPAGASSLPPIVFFHGITPGWIAYAALVLNLAANRGIFLIELDCIKIKSLVFTMPSPDKFANIVRLIIQRHGYEQVSVVGHSFGTITAGWFASYFPDMISHISFIDPVSLLLGLPDVAFNFLYRKPSSVVEWIIYLFAARELTISHTLHRHFWWYRNVFWLEELPASVGVLLCVAGNDEVAKASALHEYGSRIQKHREELLEYHIRTGINTKSDVIGSVEVVYFQGYSHGQLLLNPWAQRALAEALNKNEKVQSVKSH